MEDLGARHTTDGKEFTRESLAEGTGVISYQVVQEVLGVLTRKVVPLMTATDADHYLDQTLRPLWKVQPSEDLIRPALRLQELCSLSWYHSLIVAAALSAGCERLLTEDLQNGLAIEGLSVEDPFAAA